MPGSGTPRGRQDPQRRQNPQSSQNPQRRQNPQSSQDPQSGRASQRRAARERRRDERTEVRRFTRRSRRRRLGWVMFAASLAVLAGLVAGAVYSPLLALRTITVQGTRTVSAAEVRDALKDQVGTPLALLDYDAVRQGLGNFPRIRSFVTEIVPPSTLVVHIVERSAVGVIATSQGFASVDPAGVVLESSATRPQGAALIDVGEQGTDSTAFSSVAEVLLALPEAVRSRVDIAQASSRDDVRLVLAGSGQSVVWGSAERSGLKARVLEDLMALHGASSSVKYDVSAPLSPVVRR